MPFDAYLSLLRPHGHLVLVGVAEEASLPNVHPTNLIMSKSCPFASLDFADNQATYTSLDPSLVRLRI